MNYLPTNIINQGNVIKVLQTFPDESVDCLVTSPPYYGLRSYGTDPQMWGGREGCGHEWVYGGILEKNPFCIHCNAWKGELGLEPTYQLYLEHLWMIFDEVKRVLKKTGTCWVNIGDSYGTVSGSGFLNDKVRKNNDTTTLINKANEIRKNLNMHKSLLQIPNRFSIGMTDRGWVLRNEIIWYKRSCMPSSATDRFTVDYEKLFFFTKSTKYYFEQQFESLAEASLNDYRFINPQKDTSKRKQRDFPGALDRGSGFLMPNERGRNKRCVWDITPQPFRDAHFATFPPKLIETPIKAGCPENGIVLDPFIGSGTTALVASLLNRKWIGIELKPEYIKIANTRLKKELGVFYRGAI